MSRSRVIVVQTTVYGTDNAGALDAMKKLGSQRSPVSPLLTEDLRESPLDEMDRAGIQRFSVPELGNRRPNRSEIGRKRFQAAVERIKNRKWHIQILRAAFCNRGDQRASRGRSHARSLRSLRGHASGAPELINPASVRC